MTPEELDEARAKEALRIWDEEDGVTDEGHAVIAARLAREGWTPPEPVDPDILAFREWGERKCGKKEMGSAISYRAGHFDQGFEALAFIAGARMAREQERERESNMFTKQKSVARDKKREDLINIFLENIFLEKKRPIDE